jgi:hypothetical protein
MESLTPIFRVSAREIIGYQPSAFEYGEVTGQSKRLREANNTCRQSRSLVNARPLYLLGSAAVTGPGRFGRTRANGGSISRRVTGPGGLWDGVGGGDRCLSLSAALEENRGGMGAAATVAHIPEVWRRVASSGRVLAHNIRGWSRRGAGLWARGIERARSR